MGVLRRKNNDDADCGCSPAWFSFAPPCYCSNLSGDCLRHCCASMSYTITIM